jgi:hypothetical protein
MQCHSQWVHNWSIQMSIDFREVVWHFNADISNVSKQYYLRFIRLQHEDIVWFVSFKNQESPNRLVTELCFQFRLYSYRTCWLFFLMGLSLVAGIALSIQRNNKYILKSYIELTFAHDLL